MLYKEKSNFTGDTIRKIVLLAILLAGVFVLPYFFPVAPAVSRSYIAGFSNRVAVLILIAGTGVFALLTGGKIAEHEVKNSRLSLSALFALLIFTCCVCLLRVHLAPSGFLGGETYYFVNRQQMIVSGLAPYRQFEFVYGPLLLYPTLWVKSLLSVTILHAYDIVWFANWFCGIVMIWMVVRAIDFSISRRNLLFLYLALAELVWSDFGGLNYTPLRAYMSAFVIVVTQQAWLATKRSWILALFSVISVGIALSISVEQAISAAFGLGVYLLWLTVNRQFPVRAFVASLAGMLACFGVASRLGLLVSLKSFASGGYSYPLLPSFSICVALITYIAAGCVLYQAIRAKSFQSVSVPLVLAGCALLPAALGRCDLLHISAATPAFAVGTASLFRMRSSGKAWMIVVFIALVLVPFGLRRSDQFWRRLGILRSQPSSAGPKPNEAPNVVTNQFYVSEVELTPLNLPCDRTYFAPSYMALPTAPNRPECVDTGYFQGLVDVTTPQTIEDKVQELRERPHEPLILENLPLDAQFPTELSDLDSLRRDTGSFWSPSPRRLPVRYTPIADYIRSHYVPGRLFADGRMQIWEPKEH